MLATASSQPASGWIVYGCGAIHSRIGVAWELVAPAQARRRKSRSVKIPTTRFSASATIIAPTRRVFIRSRAAWTGWSGATRAGSAFMTSRTVTSAGTGIRPFYHPIVAGRDDPTRPRPLGGDDL